MSYTPDMEKLWEPTAALYEAIDSFLKPVKARIDNPQDWDDKHIDELHSLRKELLDIQFKIREYKRG